MTLAAAHGGRQGHRGPGRLPAVGVQESLLGLGGAAISCLLSSTLSAAPARPLADAARARSERALSSSLRRRSSCNWSGASIAVLPPINLACPGSDGSFRLRNSKAGAARPAADRKAVACHGVPKGGWIRHARRREQRARAPV